MEEKLKSEDNPLGVPPSEFHPHKPPAPFKKRGNVKTAILVGILIVVVDILIYFFLIKPDDAQLLKAIEPLKPVETTSAPSVTMPSKAVQDPAGATQSRVSSMAKADLAKRLNIPESEIEVVSEAPVTWNDGSLGCPKPDMMYTQAIVEGTKIVLSAKNNSYDYHAGSDDNPFLCEKPIQ